MELYVACKETNDRIVYVETIAEAREIIASYEAEDKRDGTYIEDFYCITDGEWHELTDDEIEVIEDMSAEEIEGFTF